MGLTAKSIVLELLSAGAPKPGAVRALVEACALFGISENSTRVTLARLVADGTLEAVDRGTYGLASRTDGITRQIRSWRTVEDDAIRWRGDWLAVHTGALARTDRATVRRRDRALAMFGLRSLRRGLDVRPDNLRAGSVAIRERLVSLGLEPEAPVFRATFDEALDGEAQKLWDGRALASSYRAMRKKLERWEARRASLALDDATRESFLLGRDAIRLIIFDPLLPGELVDVAERAAFVAAARRFDTIGRRIWATRFGVARSIVGVTESEHAGVTS